MAQEIEWRKSTYSGGGGGNCIEVSESRVAIRVRDSKDTTGPILTFAPEQWTAFVDFARSTPHGSPE